MLFVDRPLARYAATFHLDRGFLASAPVTSPILVAVAIMAVAGGAVVLATRSRLPGPIFEFVTAAIVTGLAMSWGLSLTEFLLKPLFARELPDAYLSTGTYGFHWFQYGNLYGSFPSGHSVQIASIATVLWHLRPRWRLFYILAVGVVAVALILAERHFLSDILAGTMIGVASGVMMVTIWRTRVVRES